MRAVLTAGTPMATARAAAVRPSRACQGRRLRIAFVVHDYNRVLGHSRYVAELAERFAANHEVHVFANTFSGLPSSIAAHRVPAIRRTALTSIFSFAAAASWIVPRSFDIVHAQGFSVWAPSVVTAHISNQRWMEGRREMEDGRLPWRERMFGALVIPAERRSIRDPRATVIAVSSALRRDLADAYGRDPASITVIPHGVDLSQFQPSVRQRFGHATRIALGVADDAAVFLYVGDLRKGFGHAVRALQDVPGACLVAVSRSRTDAYRELAAACGVSSRVVFQPPTAQIEKYYAASDVLVMPTPYDAFGMVVTEAMACGLPVITTAQAGASELLVDGVHGRVLPSASDVAALTGAMQVLLDGRIRAAMGRAAADLMLEHSWDRVADRTLDVYMAHLERHAAR